jgi:hypothetical protein
MVFTEIDTKREERDFLREVEEVKQWWTSSRFRKVKRYDFGDGGLIVDRTLLRVWFLRGGL